MKNKKIKEYLFIEYHLEIRNTKEALKIIKQKITAIAKKITDTELELHITDTISVESEIVCTNQSMERLQ